MVAHASRPPPLNRPKIPTILAAVIALIPVISWAIGEATAKIAIPHVTLMKSINQSIQKRRVLIASFAVSCDKSSLILLVPFCFTSSYPLGTHPSGGGARYWAEAVITEK